jgi:hypothetical protein
MPPPVATDVFLGARPRAPRQVPTAHPSRAWSLGKLVAAHGYGPRKFGTAFW